MEFENELTAENRKKLATLKRIRKEMEVNEEFQRYQRFRKLGVPEDQIAKAIYEEDKQLLEQGFINDDTEDSVEITNDEPDQEQEDQNP